MFNKNSDENSALMIQKYRISGSTVKFTVRVPITNLRYQTSNNIFQNCCQKHWNFEFLLYEETQMDLNKPFFEKMFFARWEHKQKIQMNNLAKTRKIP